MVLSKPDWSQETVPPLTRSPVTLSITSTCQWPLIAFSRRFSTKGVSASGRSSIPSNTYCRVLFAIGRAPLEVHCSLAVAAEISFVDSCCLPGQFRPYSDERVVGGCLFRVLSLVRADVVKAVG